MLATRGETTGAVAMLRGRIGGVRARDSIAELAGELESLRRAAAVQGLASAVAIIHALESALARGERGALVDGWLMLLADAFDCGRADGAAADAFAAACSVRLAG